MELLAHTVQAVARMAGIKPWRVQRFAFTQRHFPRQIQRFGLQITTAIRFHFAAQTMVAAPAQMHAPHSALLFTKCGRSRNHGREMFMRGAPPAIFQHEAVVFETNAVWLEFTCPAPMKRHDFQGAFSNGQSDSQAIHLPRSRA
ncbi:hypothetical protein D3C75_993540 [compost metagenome]